MAEQVSGPSKFAKRTDMNTSKQPVRYMSGGSYGEGQALLQQQQSAPMAGKPSVAQVPSATDIQRAMMGKVTPLTAMTERPSEVITEGSRVGLGSGFDTSDLPMLQKPSLENVLSELMKYDETGDVAEIYNSVINKGI